LKPPGPALTKAKDRTLVMAAPKYITLEEVFEHSDYSLEPLYKAAETWFPNKKHTEAMGPRFAFAESLGFQPLKDEKRLQLAYERELEEATAHFRRLLATREWAIEIRRWDQLDEAWTPLRPDLASRLSIRVSAKALSLHRPDGGSLDCRLFEPSAPVEAEANETKIPLKRLLEDITDELPFPAPPDRVHGWKKVWAAKAADVINQRHRKEPKRVKGTTARSIQNMMGKLKLWPE
jgi:hypothetical protein